jgi:hypothetical protein
MISTAQVPDNIMKYLRNTKNKKLLLRRKRRVFSGIQLICVALSIPLRVMSRRTAAVIPRAENARLGL